MSNGTYAATRGGGAAGYSGGYAGYVTSPRPPAASVGNDSDPYSPSYQQQPPAPVPGATVGPYGQNQSLAELDQRQYAQHQQQQQQQPQTSFPQYLHHSVVAVNAPFGSVAEYGSVPDYLIVGDTVDQIKPEMFRTHDYLCVGGGTAVCIAACLSFFDTVSWVNVLIAAAAFALAVFTAVRARETVVCFRKDAQTVTRVSYRLYRKFKCCRPHPETIGTFADIEDAEIDPPLPLTECRIKIANRLYVVRRATCQTQEHCDAIVRPWQNYLQELRLRAAVRPPGAANNGGTPAWMPAAV